VQIGISDYSFAEVQSGLKDGDLVALELPFDVKPGEPVKMNGGTPASNGVGTARPATAGNSSPKKAVL
jgi:hypothetical protein